MSSLQIFDSNGKINIDVVKTHFYEPLKEIPGKISITRLAFIPPEQNTDFDNSYGDDQDVFNENKTAIIKVMRSLEVKRLSSLYKRDYKAEMTQINNIVGQINQNAIEIASILGGLNETAYITVVLDGIDLDGHVLEDSREIVMSKRDIHNMIQMVKFMNQEFKTLIRGSKGKKLDKEGGEANSNSTPVPLSPNNFGKNRDTYYVINPVVVENLLARVNNIDPENDFDPLQNDTMGVVDDRKAIHPLFTNSNNFFQLSEAFERGLLKGSTFTNFMTLLSCNFRISQWYALLNDLADPIIYIRKDGKSSPIEDIVYIYTKEGVLVDNDKDMYYYVTKSKSETNEQYKEKIKAVKEGIKNKISRLSLQDLQKYLDQTKATKLYGLERNMIALDVFEVNGSASKTYEKGAKGLKLVDVDANSDLSAVDALNLKPRFNKDNISNSNFLQFLNVVGREATDQDRRQLKDKMFDSADEDAESIQQFAKQMVEARKQYQKIFMIGYIQTQLKLQISKLNQVGATVGTKE